MPETSHEPIDQIAALQRVMEANVGTSDWVGHESVAVITRLKPAEEYDGAIGNILRRTCKAVGGTACQAVCARRGTPEYEANADKACADRNLAQGLDKLGIDARDVLMVAVTGDDVGFGDRLAEYEAAEKLKQNPEGWRELPGFNAFFARPEEVPAVGSRLADCAHLEFEFRDKDGNTVIGFEHGTRPNMTGSSRYKFEIDGEPVSYTAFVLHAALQHYEADPASVQIRLGSSIRAENFVKRFDSREAMEEHLPGWCDANFLSNVSNPDWMPGDPVDKDDVWHADARGLILHDIDETLQRWGIPRSQFTADNMLDPADTDGEFSSHQNRDTYGDTRDLYLIAHHSAFTGRS